MTTRTMSSRQDEPAAVTYDELLAPPSMDGRSLMANPGVGLRVEGNLSGDRPVNLRPITEGYVVSWDQLLESMPDGIALIDEYGVIRHVNENLEVLTGYPRAELVNREVEELVPSRYRGEHVKFRETWAQHPMSRAIGGGFDLTLLCRDGSELAVSIALSPFVPDGKLWMGKPWVIAAIRDDSVRRAAECARADLEQRFHLAFEKNMAPMIISDYEDRILLANDAFCELVGYSREELIGSTSTLFTFPEDLGITEAAHERIISGAVNRERYVKRYRHKNGRVVFIEVSKSPARDDSGKTLYFLVSQRDITLELTLTEQLSQQALRDPLTWLANQALFTDRLSQAQPRVIHQGGLGAVMLIDLDDFKNVNDTLGHVAGDHLLIEIGRRLEQMTRSSDTLCRYGGDEFLYLAEGLRSADKAEELATRLLEVFSEPFFIDGSHVEQHASIGVVVWDKSNTDTTDLINDANVAMYEAKSQGKNRHVVFTPDMHT